MSDPFKAVDEIAYRANHGLDPLAAPPAETSAQGEWVWHDRVLSHPDYCFYLPDEVVGKVIAEKHNAALAELRQQLAQAQIDKRALQEFFDCNPNHPWHKIKALEFQLSAAQAACKAACKAKDEALERRTAPRTGCAGSRGSRRTGPQRGGGAVTQMDTLFTALISFCAVAVILAIPARFPESEATMAGVAGFLAVAAVLYVFGTIMRSVGRREGFANGCRSERDYNHQRQIAQSRERHAFWIGGN